MISENPGHYAREGATRVKEESFWDSRELFTSTICTAKIGSSAPKEKLMTDRSCFAHFDGENGDKGHLSPCYIDTLVDYFHSIDHQTFAGKVSLFLIFALVIDSGVMTVHIHGFLSPRQGFATNTALSREMSFARRG